MWGILVFFQLLYGLQNFLIYFVKFLGWQDVNRNDILLEHNLCGPNLVLYIFVHKYTIEFCDLL